MKGTAVRALVFALAACAPTETRVGSARLPDADATVKAPEGPVIEVGKTPVPEKMSGPVRVAADGETPYADVVKAAAAVKKAGGTPYLLVTRRNLIEALPEPAPPDDALAARLAARLEGKACVSPPDNDGATCVSRVDQKRIDRAFVRQILWKAFDEWTVTHVRVIIDPALPWADAVRAIDGARTCCAPEKGIVVHVEPTY